MGAVLHNVDFVGQQTPNIVDFNHNTVEIGQMKLRWTSLLLASVSFQYYT